MSGLALSGNVIVSGQLIPTWMTALSTYTFTTLPASPATGTLVNISDSTTVTWGATITVGLGLNNVLARYNGTNWTVVGI